MTKFAFLLLLVASATAFAEQTPADEISARSGLPASEVSALLADCESNQTSMNFCAWRDQIVAERELQHVVDRQASEHPERKAALDAKIAKWKKARDASCEKSARKEWGEGSMRPAAQAICATASTKKMTKRLSTPDRKAS
ncbi:lysozyme inhibitor LprI family protein [Burkholderia ubonensis]|uniref:lysozyme inhibitor LprI family protein n=1 Tax=Burkholderia ubonensis TaxID=101571 RepID=UPI00358FC677